LKNFVPATCRDKIHSTARVPATCRNKIFRWPGQIHPARRKLAKIPDQNIVQEESCRKIFIKTCCGKKSGEKFQGQQEVVC
jgi:hypothetical protein